MEIFKGLGILTAALLFVALAPPTPSRAVSVLPVCHVTKRNSQYLFTSRSHEGFLMILKLLSVPVDLDVKSLELWDGSRVGAGTLLWKIEATPGPPIRVLKYGEVPAGYTQLYPIEVVPEPLQPGHEYALNCNGGLARFRVTAAGIKELSE